MTHRDRANSFDLLRLLAALQVVHSHAVEHLHITYGTVGTMLTGIATFFPGVPIFFVISGFLISRAFERSSSVTTYARNRVLRIFPALWVCLGASLILLAAFGVLTSAVAVSPVFWGWIAGQLTIVQFFNPAAFRGFGVGVINGSLWTIAVELQFYFAVPLIYRWCIYRRSRQVSNLLLGGLTVVSLFVWARWSSAASGTMSSKLMQVTLAPHLFMFLVGILVSRNWSRLVGAFEGRGLLWGAGYLAFRIALHPSAASTHGAVALITEATAMVWLGCATLSLAYTAKSISRSLLRGHDISYGVYLYHMLVVNACVQLGFVGNRVALAAVITTTVAAAALSWVGVERPMLQKKKAASGLQTYVAALPAFTS